uniref:hypothetical protein n=1 Tax=Xanthomonas citri TaxID=346 RepID=UPI001F467857|nr:hypothetical protein [Xanthomonas citri]
MVRGDRFQLGSSTAAIPKPYREGCALDVDDMSGRQDAAILDDRACPGLVVLAREGIPLHVGRAVGKPMHQAPEPRRALPW